MCAMSREEEVSSQVPCPPSGLNIFGQGAKQPSFCYHFYSSSAMIEGSFFFLMSFSCWISLCCQMLLALSVSLLYFCAVSLGVTVPRVVFGSGAQTEAGLELVTEGGIRRKWKQWRLPGGLCKNTEELQQCWGAEGCRCLFSQPLGGEKQRGVKVRVDVRTNTQTCQPHGRLTQLGRRKKFSQPPDRLIYSS